ncbi:hypothetical protein TNCV_1063161 [Trichonephila clavipes]|nr:hypothetical protein TNCV_1063161 [Trichonephila clavipes]
MLARVDEQRQISASGQWLAESHNREGRQRNCQNNYHSTGFVIINYPPCGQHSCVHDPPQTIKRAEFTLVLTVKQLTSHTRTPSSPIAVGTSSINMELF